MGEQDPIRPEAGLLHAHAVLLHRSRDEAVVLGERIVVGPAPLEQHRLAAIERAHADAVRPCRRRSARAALAPHEPEPAVVPVAHAHDHRRRALDRLPRGERQLGEAGHGRLLAHECGGAIVQRAPDAAALERRPHAAAQHGPRPGTRQHDRAREARGLPAHERQTDAGRGRVGVGEQPLGAVRARVHVVLLRDRRLCEHEAQRGHVGGLESAHDRLQHLHVRHASHAVGGGQRARASLVERSRSSSCSGSWIASPAAGCWCSAT